MINRREFIKAMGILVTACLLPPKTPIDEWDAGDPLEDVKSYIDEVKQDIGLRLPLTPCDHHCMACDFCMGNCPAFPGRIIGQSVYLKDSRTVTMSPNIYPVGYIASINGDNSCNVILDCMPPAVERKFYLEEKNNE